MPTTERILDLLVEPREHGPAEPSHIPIRLSGSPDTVAPVVIHVAIPGPSRAVSCRTWDDLDPVLTPAVRHRLGGMLGSYGTAHVLTCAWSPAYELTLEDGSAFPIGTHVEVFGSHQPASP